MALKRIALVVRHAKAGDRLAGGVDRDRGLSSPGRAQAERLPAQLAAFPVSAVLSSPFRRCVETVRPLASAQGLEVQPAPELAEGSRLPAVLALLWSLEGCTVLCSHGDVIGDLVGELVELGLVPAAEARWEKGATWVLGLEGVYIRAARYLPPPELLR